MLRCIVFPFKIKKKTAWNGNWFDICAFVCVCTGVQKLVEVYKDKPNFADAEAQEDTRQRLHGVSQSLLACWLAWLIDWLGEQVSEWVSDQVSHRMVVWQIASLLPCLVDWMIDCLSGLFIHLFIYWLIRTILFVRLINFWSACMQSLIFGDFCDDKIS